MIFSSTFRDLRSYTEVSVDEIATMAGRLEAAGTSGQPKEPRA
jgi:hypothetical protein